MRSSSVILVAYRLVRLFTLENKMMMMMTIMRTMLPSNLHSTYPAHQSGVVGKAPPATSSDISRVDSAFACVTSPPREPHTTRSRDDCQRTAYTDFHSSRRSTFWRVLGPPSNHVGTRRTAYDSPPVK